MYNFNSNISIPKYLLLKIIILVSSLLILFSTLFIKPNIKWPPKIPTTNLNIKMPKTTELISMITLSIIIFLLHFYIFFIFIFIDKLNQKKILILFNFLISSFIVFSFLLLIIQIMKLYFAIPRPNCIALCKPDKLGYCDISTNERKKLVIFSLTSFPSGHAASITYFTVLSSLLVLTYPISIFFKLEYGTLYYIIFSIVSLYIFIIINLLVCFSRIWDYYHRVIDILIGVILGTIFSLITIIIKQKIFNNYFN